MEIEEVILVDASDRPIGREEKLAAHRDGGKLHRAFSVFIFDAAGRLLLQRRAAGKYHFGGLWTNTCCGHPRWGEEVSAAARRRLREELDIDCAVNEVGTFIYTATDPHSGLTENELDHVFTGTFAGEPVPNPQEIDTVRWADPEDVQRELATHPDRFTPWLPAALAEVMKQS